MVRPRSAKPTSVRRWLIIVSITIVGTIAVYYWVIEPFMPYGIHQRHMKEAERHLPAIREKLESDARFREITASVTTAMNGGIEMFGALESEAHWEDLKKLVQATSPPRPVKWTIRILPSQEHKEIRPQPPW